MASRYPVTRVLRILRGGLEGREPDIVPPIHVSAPYRFTGAQVDPLQEVKYSRENNPTTMLLEEALAAAEGAEWCLAFNTGMAALSALLEGLLLLHKGSRPRVAASRLLYGTTRSLLSRMAGLGLVEARYAGPPWGELLDAATGADIVLVETIGNPTLRVPPLRELARICTEREKGCTFIVDNTFASPYLYRPLEDLPGDVVVIESLTKYIGGHNDVLGGIVCGRGEDLRRSIWETRKTHGTILQPLEAYLAARGLRTLHLRVEYSSRSAQAIAEGLLAAEGVVAVHYPSLPGHPDRETAERLFPGLYGGVLSFDVGSATVAKKLMENLSLVVPSPSLGGVESIIAYPYESSHRGLSEEEKKSLGITGGLLRLSVGLEDPRDVLEDILAALRVSRRS